MTLENDEVKDAASCSIPEKIGRGLCFGFEPQGSLIYKKNQVDHFIFIPIVIQVYSTEIDHFCPLEIIRKEQSLTNNILLISEHSMTLVRRSEVFMQAIQTSNF